MALSKPYTTYDVQGGDGVWEVGTVGRRVGSMVERSRVWARNYGGRRAVPEWRAQPIYGIV